MRTGLSRSAQGWLEAGLFVVTISALAVTYAIAEAAGAHALVFVVAAMGLAAAGMLAVTGLGDDVAGVLLAPASLVFGVTSIALEALFFAVLALMPPAEASLAFRLAVPASLIVGVVMLGRRLNATTLAGAAIIVGAASPAVLAAAPEDRLLASGLVVAGSLIVAVKTFASELHPGNRRARGVLDHLRVTGLVVLVTAVIGLAVLVPASLAAGGALGGLIPQPSDFVHPPTLTIALVVGAPIILAMTYLTFASVVKIGTESFLGTTALTPLGAYLAQALAAGFGLMAWPGFPLWLLALSIVGLGGVALVIKGLAQERGSLAPEQPLDIGQA
ncbi:MAG: hypothetical protein NW205_12490 [Hyphomicrobiaceae bacterium]|nr:hypothetical protein [Hyphomicrobiaceae bacterium]